MLLDMSDPSDDGKCRRKRQLMIEKDELALRVLTLTCGVALATFGAPIGTYELLS